VHCHLLLAALYQDTGELPFQKVSSTHFIPTEQDVKQLANALPAARPQRWTAKQVFSLLSLWTDFKDERLRPGFDGYSFEFLAYLITGDGTPDESTAVGALLQMVDGVLDADRLDYVYRDASVTIGSLSRPSTVLETIVAYEPRRVVVNDPRPVLDFLSTRMRLWTFVYSSADVRFRQALLKTVLNGRWDSIKTEGDFERCGLEPELPFAKFLLLDDLSLMDRIERLPEEHLTPYRKEARRLLLHSSLGYECRILKRGSPVIDETTLASVAEAELPYEMFFDLLLDHGHHQLYKANSVLIRQGLTSKIADAVPLEASAGAFSALFAADNTAMLVRDGYYVFLPKERRGGHWPAIERAMKDGSLFHLLSWEGARRAMPPTDTRTDGSASDGRRAIAISYCRSDLPLVVRIVRDLYRRRRRYRLLLRPFDGTGSTPAGNSADLITEAEAVLAVVSSDYLRKATDGRSYISIEVRFMHDRAQSIPIVPVSVDPRSELDAVQNWNWGQMNEAWSRQSVVISERQPLRDASEDVLRSALDEALRSIDGWRGTS
jgi:hypothetical protein